MWRLALLGKCVRAAEIDQACRVRWTRCASCVAPGMNQVEAYAGEAAEEFPLGAYAVMMLVFVGGFGSMLVRASKAGRLPKQIGARDIALLGVATHRLTRLATRERVTAALRFPFTKLEGTAGAGELRERARGHGLRRAIGSLLTCQFCVGPWTAAALTAGLVAKPRETRVVASMLAMVALSDFMHQAYAKARSAS